MNDRLVDVKKDTRNKKMGSNIQTYDKDSQNYTPIEVIEEEPSNNPFEMVDDRVSSNSKKRMASSFKVPRNGDIKVEGTNSKT